MKILKLDANTDKPVYVNFDKVQMFIESKGETNVVFESDNEFVAGYISVQETPEQIYEILKDGA